VNDVDLASLLGEHARRQSVPGAAIGILRAGAVATACHGIADVRSGEAVTAETRFAAGSLTKSMVATVIARLADAGQLSLDDHVATLVRELRDADWAARATVRDLMANRSGLPLRADLEFGFDRHPDVDDGALSRLVAEVGVAAAPPRSVFWSYSNVGWCLLGRAIEHVTGGTWEDAMQELLFEPARMPSTTFANAPDSIPRAVGHGVTDGGATPIDRPGPRAYGPAGTTLLTTVTDLLTFARLQFDDASLAALRAPHSDVSIAGWLDAWGLGWARFDWGGEPVWGWDGLIGGERSILRMLPGLRAAVVLMANANTGRALYRALFADLMPEEFGISVPALRLVPSPGGAGGLSRFAGTYAWPDRQIRVMATEEGLRIVSSSQERGALPLDHRTFVVDALDPDDPTVTFGEFDPTGRPTVLYDMLWGLPRVDA
jgi:CubicO group peptidase (beta-lactamase class C family)